MIKSAETWILLKYMLLGEKSQSEKETILYDSTYVMGFLGISVSKESACSAGDTGLIPGSRRSPGEGYGNLLKYSCLENPMDRGTWWITVHRVARLECDLVTKPNHLCNILEKAKP